MQRNDNKRNPNNNPVHMDRAVLTVTTRAADMVVELGAMARTLAGTAPMKTAS